MTREQVAALHDVWEAGFNPEARTAFWYKAVGELLDEVERLQYELSTLLKD